MKQEYKQILKQYYTTDEAYFDELDKHFYKNLKEYTAFLEPELFDQKTVLEAGCGSGAMANWIATKFSADVVGIDLSTYALINAKDKYEGKFIQGDLEELPFKDESFDTIFMFDVLEHVIFVEKMFKEFKRVLKAGGKVLIVSPNLIFNEKVPLGLKMLEVLDVLNPWSSFRYVKPDTSECACGDREASLITNPIKVQRALKRAGFSLLQKHPLRCRVLAQK